MQKYVKMLTKIFDELSIIGDPLDKENQVVHLLASSPESYDMLVTALEASPDIPKLKIVTERLLHEETRQRPKNRYENRRSMLQKKTQMMKERRLLVWLLNMLYLLIDEATGLLILMRLVTCVIMTNSLIKPLVWRCHKK